MVNKELRLYVLMRNDLKSMTPGRCMAQSNHAASVLEHEFGDHTNVQEWKRQTKQGFGTCIVLSASYYKIQQIIDAIKAKKLALSGWVVDPEYGIRVTPEVANLLHQNYDAKYCTYTFDYNNSDAETVAVIRKENTCAFILGTKEELEPYLGSLPLY